MALGKFADRNLAKTATLGGGAWSAAFPLANLQNDKRFVTAPARCLTPAVLADSQFEADLGTARPVDLVALLFHNMRPGAKYRLTLRGALGTFDAPALQTDWLDVYGRAFDSASLLWEDENWWLGTVADEDLDLYRRHKFIAVETTVAIGIRVELDDQDNPDGFIDVGGLWISGSWSPSINFDRGRDLRLLPRDLVDETPSGRLVGEARISRRQLSVTWSNLSSAEAYRLFDGSARGRAMEMIILVPDIESETSLAREAFPAVFSQAPPVRFAHEHINSVAGVFKEILA